MDVAARVPGGPGGGMPAAPGFAPGEASWNDVVEAMMFLLVAFLKGGAF